MSKPMKCLKKTSYFLFCVGISLFIQSCTSTPIDENDPAALFQDAEEEVQSDHYLIALEKLKNIKNRFPYSKYSLEAHLKIADVYFLQELYVEAAATYESFRDLHPKHPKSAYALFRMAKSYLNSVPSEIDRDLTPAEKSLNLYEIFIQKYPNAPEVVEARQDIVKLRNLLSQKEFMIAEFYFKRKHYLSAKNRYQKLLELYSDTEMASTARNRLEAISHMDQKIEETHEHGSK